MEHIFILLPEKTKSNEFCLPKSEKMIIENTSNIPLTISLTFGINIHKSTLESKSKKDYPVASCSLVVIEYVGLDKEIEIKATFFLKFGM